MKRVHTLWMCVILLLHSHLYAQESPLPINQAKAAKPFLFASLPDKFECNTGKIEKIFSAEINEQINAQLSGQFLIQGKVVDKNQQNAGTFSINIRLSNYDNALFHISARLLPDNSIHIQGGILHPHYGDVLILYKENNKYYFKKQLQRLYMAE